jgi:hypothetical protein
MTRDEKLYMWAETLVAAIAALCAPSGWRVTVFLGLLMVSPHYKDLNEP